MKPMKSGTLGIAVAIAIAGSLALPAPAIAGKLLNGASVTNGARGTTNGEVLNGSTKVIVPQTIADKQFDVVAANINLPARIDLPLGTDLISGIDWHTHPGPTFGIVTGGGTLTIIDDDCVAHHYATGDAFVPPVNPHTARNYSDKPVTVRATFFMTRSGSPTPPTSFLSDADDDVLDVYCGLDD